ncbi:unnamed protein product [Ectocarpus sp. 13 AM-2016]
MNPAANEKKSTEPDDFFALGTGAKRELLAKLHAVLRARAGLGDAEKKPAPPTVIQDDQKSAPSPKMKVHPALSLKFGQVLFGTLLSPSMGSRIFASRKDLAILFAKATGEPLRDAEGRVTRPTPEMTITLVASDPGKVNEMLAVRAELLAEEL